MYALSPWVARSPRAAGPRAKGIHIRQILNGHVTTIICNTFTPQIKGICCGLNVMYHIPQLQVCYNFPGVLQLPLECATTSTGMCYNFDSHRNAYNYICYNFQWHVAKIPGRFDTNTKNTASYKAEHIDIDCVFELRC